MEWPSPPAKIGTPSRIIGLAFRSSGLSAAAAFALGGAAFAVANLLLARSLSPLEFGLFSLIVGLLNLGVQLAPLGTDGAINRARVRPTFWLFRRAFAASLMAALVVGFLSQMIYGLAVGLLGLIVVGVVSGGLTLVAAAIFQSRHSFVVSLCLTQLANLALLAAAGLAVRAHSVGFIAPLVCFVCGYVCASVFGWRALLRSDRVTADDSIRFGWVEPLSYAGVNAAGFVLSSLERLMVPKVLSLEDLATFGVMAAVVIAPFRMLQLGIGYTLLPRLRAAPDLAERRRLVRDEAVIMGAVVLSGAILISFLAPVVVNLVVAGKYELPRNLLLAGLVTSVLRAASGFTKGAVMALCSNRELAVLNVLMWVAMVLGIVGALVGAQWGLVGVIYGASLGWLTHILASAAITGRHLLHR
jgi:O-antigen/teichoic acid export membrane protein